MGRALKALADALTRALEIVMVACLVVMLVMVFGNVMLRLFLNTGIDLSEEVPRFAFVWMTFLGAIVGMRKRAHLGVDIVVQMLPTLGRKVCWGISQAIMLVCCGYIVYGTWLQHDVQAGETLYSIWRKFELPGAELSRLIAIEGPDRPLTRLQSGKSVFILIDDNRRIQRVEIRSYCQAIYRYDRQGEGFALKE